MKLNVNGKQAVDETINYMSQIEYELFEIESIIRNTKMGIGLELWLSKLNDLESKYNKSQTQLKRFKRQNS